MNEPSNVSELVAEANRIAAQTDDEQANVERKKLIDRLSTLVEREDLEKLVLGGVELLKGERTTGEHHRPGEIDLDTVDPQAEFHDLLRDLCHRYQVGLDAYPNFRLYMQYIDTLRKATDI